MDKQLNTVQHKIVLGTQNRKDLTNKYELDKNPAKFQELRTFGQEVVYKCLDKLRETHNPVEFGKVIDSEVVGKLKEKFNEEGDDYGDRAAKAYIERSGTKARDEIGMGLKGLGVENETTRGVFDLLPRATSGE